MPNNNTVTVFCHHYLTKETLFFTHLQKTYKKIYELLDKKETSELWEDVINNHIMVQCKTVLHYLCSWHMSSIKRCQPDIKMYLYYRFANNKLQMTPITVSHHSFTSGPWLANWTCFRLSVSKDGWCFYLSFLIWPNCIQGILGVVYILCSSNTVICGNSNKRIKFKN